MKLLKTLFLATIKISFLGIIFIPGSPFIYANDEIFRQCISPDYNFICTDLDNFLQRMGIDFNKNIISYKDLHQVDKKRMGCHKGSFYVDQSGAEYFVKESQLFNEFMGAKIAHLFLDQNAAPIVKVVKDKKDSMASLKIHSFIRRKDTSKNSASGEVLLAVVMDLIALEDRSKRNQGYSNSSTDPNRVMHARVDFDKSFCFGKKRWKEVKINSDYLDLSHLMSSIKKFSKKEIIEALETVVKVSNKDLMMTVLDGWMALKSIGWEQPMEMGFLFGQQIIERKNAFHEVLKDLRTGKLKTKKAKIKTAETKKVELAKKDEHQNHKSEVLKEGQSVKLKSIKPTADAVNKLKLVNPTLLAKKKTDLIKKKAIKNKEVVRVEKLEVQ